MTATDQLDDAQRMLVEAQADRYERVRAAISEKLRDLAGRIDRDSSPSVSVIDGHPDYLRAVEQVVHEIAWATANLKTAELLAAGIDAHNAIRGRAK